jgi:hypothetical protein
MRLKKRILALDIHPKTFGFVVLEGPETLLDWGVRRFRRSATSIDGAERVRLARLLRQYAPSSVVFERPRRRKIAPMLAMIRDEAGSREVPVRMLAHDTVRASFPEHANKHEVAATIATRLPELCNILPPKRKPWKTEPYTLCIFDAAAAGIAHYRTVVQDDSTPSPELASDFSNGLRG